MYVAWTFRLPRGHRSQGAGHSSTSGASVNLPLVLRTFYVQVLSPDHFMGCLWNVTCSQKCVLLLTMCCCRSKLNYDQENHLGLITFLRSKPVSGGLRSLECCQSFYRCADNNQGRGNTLLQPSHVISTSHAQMFYYGGYRLVVWCKKALDVYCQVFEENEETNIVLPL